MLRVLVFYLLLVNLAAYFLFWLDKRRARRGGPRISEKELLLCALAGGSPGALLAMRRFRHKTRKRWFRLAFFAVVALQIGVVVLVIWA
ncbi:MAG: DUF1294 domain-containing protein [Planctomycetota bacterium]